MSLPARGAAFDEQDTTIGDTVAGRCNEDRLPTRFRASTDAQIERIQHATSIHSNHYLCGCPACHCHGCKLPNLRHRSQHQSKCHIIGTTGRSAAGKLHGHSRLQRTSTAISRQLVTSWFVRRGWLCERPTLEAISPNLHTGSRQATGWRRRRIRTRRQLPSAYLALSKNRLNNNIFSSCSQAPPGNTHVGS